MGVDARVMNCLGNMYSYSGEKGYLKSWNAYKKVIKLFPKTKQAETAAYRIATDMCYLGKTNNNKDMLNNGIAYLEKLHKIFPDGTYSEVIKKRLIEYGGKL